MLGNVARAVSANLFSLVMSTILVLVVPKLVGVTDYGYWQLYVFYLSWVGVLHLGWVDGIYLKIAGQHYASLDFPRLTSQFWSCFSWMALLGAGMLAFGLSGAVDANLSFLFVMLAPGVILVCSNSFLNFVLQSTNRIAQYARITMIERAVFASLVAVFMGVGIREFRYLVLAEVVARLSTFAYLSSRCHEIVYRRPRISREDVAEIADNVRIGSKLLVANLASLGVIGVARMMIQRQWGVEVFGKLSLALGVANLVMVLVSALGVVAFPMLKRASTDSLPRAFVSIRSAFTYLVLTAMLIYFPLREVLVAWLPDYADGLRYLALLFPIGLYDGKMRLLVDSFWKAMRRESLMSLVNLGAVAFAAVWSIVAALALNNLDLSVLGIVITVAVRSLVGEVLVARDLGIATIGRSVVWATLTIAFMVLGWFDPSWSAIGTYAVLLAVVMAGDRKQIVESFRNLQGLSRGGSSVTAPRSSPDLA